MDNRKITAISKNKREALPLLYLEEDNVINMTKSTKKVIPITSIVMIKMSLVNRIYNPSIGVLEDGIKGFLTHRNAGAFSVYFDYYLDIDIYTQEDTYLFEGVDLMSSIDFIVALCSQECSCQFDDPLGLMELFKKDMSKTSLYEIFDKNYKNWSKKFKLDNPRMTIDTRLTNRVDKNV